MPQRYYDELRRYLQRQVADPHEAQDLVQEVYERLMTMQRAGKSIEEARALLYQIARNLLIDRHRLLRSRQHVSDSELSDMPAAGDSEPEAVLTGNQMLARLSGAIEGLPPRCREAFVLHKFEGLSHAQVAARMGISVNMVERHVMLAVAACRKVLQSATLSNSVPIR
ncbi:MAG TPA: RNA polymerase sigma factor [Burkholderiaceae bacterium]|nr:RNA polymerase sigma factor [Burkholderiaceae bacterium]